MTVAIIAIDIFISVMRVFKVPVGIAIIFSWSILKLTLEVTRLNFLFLVYLNYGIISSTAIKRIKITSQKITKNLYIDISLLHER